MADSLRIVVLGYIVRGPLGGMAWHHLQYVLGLHRLGHDVFFIEDSDDYASCYDPVRDATDTDPSYGLAFAGAALKRLGLERRFAFHDAHTGRWLGADASRATSFCRTADVVLDVSGVNPLRPWLADVSVRVLIDTDPAFTQIRHLTDEAARVRAEAHTAFFTYGANFGEAACRVPDDGFAWQPTRQPVVLEEWPVTAGPKAAPFTTVMQWESYPALEHGGFRFGMKAESFEPLLDLPLQTPQALELALGGATAPRARLASKGWIVRDSREPTVDPWAYQNYVRGSKGEFGVAKHGYVASHSGWFSERSAGYLASGRPVVTQETGFSDWLDADGGLLAFESGDEALAALEEIDRRYELHCARARALAEEFFDARTVLSGLLERAFASKRYGSVRSGQAMPPVKGIPAAFVWPEQKRS